MKKLTPLLLSLFLFIGCSSGAEEPNSAKKNTGFVSQAQMEEMLMKDGWDIHNTSAASFHLWEEMQPTFLILGENSKDETLLIGGFRTTELADAAYLTLVPSSDDHTEHQNQNDYDQALVTLDEGEGYWLVRQAGNYVLAGWMSSPDEASQYESLFASMQTNSSDSSSAQSQSEEESAQETPAE